MATPLVVVSEELPAGWLTPIETQFRVVIGVDKLRAQELGEVQGLLSMLTLKVDAALLDRFPNLKVVSNMAVGYDNIDLEACRARGVAIGNTPGVLTDATADLCIGLLLNIARGLPFAATDAREGRWQQWTPTGWLGTELAGATLGIVGMGKIGSAVAQRAAAFGMDLAYTSRSGHREVERELGAQRMDLASLLEVSDFVSLHLPLTNQTQALIGESAFRAMKTSAFLINTARGKLVEPRALLRALRDRWIAGAALDVTDPEPLPADDPLYRLDNCFITPHIGSATQQTRRRMAHLACSNLLAGVEGMPLPHPVEN